MKLVVVLILNTNFKKSLNQNCERNQMPLRESNNYFLELTNNGSYSKFTGLIKQTSSIIDFLST